jgi:hypothetical protein
MFERIGHSFVELDDMELIDTLEQWEGQGAETATNLDDPVTGLRRYYRDYLCDHSRVVQEMLAEPFLRAWSHVQLTVAASWNARS